MSHFKRVRAASYTTNGLLAGGNPITIHGYAILGGATTAFTFLALTGAVIANNDNTDMAGYISTTIASGSNTVVRNTIPASTTTVAVASTTNLMAAGVANVTIPAAPGGPGPGGSWPINYTGLGSGLLTGCSLLTASPTPPAAAILLTGQKVFGNLIPASTGFTPAASNGIAVFGEVTGVAGWTSKGLGWPAEGVYFEDGIYLYGTGPTAWSGSVWYS